MDLTLRGMQLFVASRSVIMYLKERPRVTPISGGSWLALR